MVSSAKVGYPAPTKAIGSAEVAESAANGGPKKDNRLMLETLGSSMANLTAGSRTFTLGKIGRRK
jgi:hypothetical protein